MADERVRNKGTLLTCLMLHLGGRILLMKRPDKGPNAGRYTLPQGGIEEGEAPTGAAIREAFEELGIVIKPEDLKLVHVLHRTKHNHHGDRVDYYFDVAAWKGNLVNKEPEKCGELRWVNPAQLPENMSPPVRHAIGQILEGILSSELHEEFFRQNGLWELD